MELKQVSRLLVSAILIGSSVCFLNNVLSDDTLLREQAVRVACGKDEIAEPWRIGRYPLWQRYAFRCKSGSVEVTCSRSLYLVGPYTCAVDGHPRSE